MAPKDNGNESFDALEGLPEGMVSQLETLISRNIQSVLDKREASRQKEVKVEPTTPSQTTAAQSSSGASTLDRIQALVVNQGLDFAQAREKVELEEMMDWYRKQSVSGAAPDERGSSEEPVSKSGIDVSQFGLDPNSPAVSQILLNAELPEAQKLFRLGQLAGKEHKNYEVPSGKTEDTRVEDQKKLEAYITEMQEATTLPSGNRRSTMKSIKHKYADMGVDVEHVHWSL